MIKPENIYKATQDAFDKEEFYELLTGSNGYNVPVLDAPANVPTDWSVVIRDGVFSLYERNPDDASKIKKDFENALEKMLNGEPVEIWEASYVIFSTLRLHKKREAPFSISVRIIMSFNNQVQKYKEELMSCTEYEGGLYSNGLLGDIERLNRLLYSKYSVCIMNNPIIEKFNDENANYILSIDTDKYAPLNSYWIYTKQGEYPEEFREGSYGSNIPKIMPIMESLFNDCFGNGVSGERKPWGEWYGSARYVRWIYEGYSLELEEELEHPRTGGSYLRIHIWEK